MLCVDKNTWEVYSVYILKKIFAVCGSFDEVIIKSETGVALYFYSIEDAEEYAKNNNILPYLVEKNEPKGNCLDS